MTKKQNLNLLYSSFIGILKILGLKMRSASAQWCQLGNIKKRSQEKCGNADRQNYNLGEISHIVLSNAQCFSCGWEAELLKINK